MVVEVKTEGSTEGDEMSMTGGLQRLAGRRALVTGASGGIGEAIAEAFVREGAQVIVHGRHAERTRAVAERLGATFVVADLADSSGPDRVAEVAAERPLDILVNNAAFEVGRRIEDLTTDVYQEMLQVDLIAPLQLMRLCLPAMRNSSYPSVINVTSIHESVPVAGNGGYASAKAALAMITRIASIEWGQYGIRVNNLAPGAVRTAMNSRLLDEIGENVFSGWIPERRVAVPAEIGTVAVFLACSESSYMTGSTVVVDGGYSNNLVRYPPGIHP